MLGAVAANVVRPTLEQFEREAKQLSSATAALALVRGAANATAERTAAREAFNAALKTWERAELVGFGPAASEGRFVGGRSLRDSIYSWPTVNPCQVDTALVNRTFADPVGFEAALVTVRGLATIERLLYVESTTNSCPADATINASGSWLALGTEELAARRADYAAAAARLVHSHASELATAWAGDYGDAFAAAGTKGSPYPDAQSAVGEVFAGLLYLDRVVKDAKLAIPAGIDPQCGKAICPELAEAVAARQSREAVVENLVAAQMLFRGSADSRGAGFDRLLSLRGAESLAEDVDTRLETALAAARALDAPIDVAVSSNRDSVVRVHAAVREVSDLLKSQVVTTLSLKVPDMGAGDND